MQVLNVTNLPHIVYPEIFNGGVRRSEWKKNYPKETESGSLWANVPPSGVQEQSPDKESGGWAKYSRSWSKISN